MSVVGIRPEPAGDECLDLKDAQLSVTTIVDLRSNANKAAAYTAIASASVAAVAGVADLLAGRNVDFTNSVAYPLLAGLSAGGIVTFCTTPIRRDCRRILQAFFASATAKDRDRAADLLLDAHLDPAEYGYNSRFEAAH